MAVLPVITSGLGALAGGLSAYDQQQARKKYYDTLASGEEAIQGDISKMSDAQKASLGATYAPLLEGYPATQSQYYDKLKNADYSQFNVTPSEFSFDTQAETQKQLNPEIDEIINRATGGIQQSAAGKNKLFSGAAGKQIARSTADITAKEYDAAAQRALSEENNKYSQWTQKFTQDIQAANLGKSNYTQGINDLGTVANQQQQNYLGKAGATLGVQNAANQATLQAKQNALGATSAKSGMGSDWMAALSGALGGAGGAGQLLNNIYNAGATKADTSANASGIGAQGSTEV